MEARVWFTSDRFPRQDHEEDHTNPGRLGKSLAEWLQAALVARGLNVHGVLAEDWGWLVVLHRKPFLLWVGCGNDEGSTERWALFIAAEVPWYRKLLGGLDTRPATSELRGHLEAILAEAPGIEDVAWE